MWSLEKRFPFPFLPYEAKNGVIAKKWGCFVLAFSPIYPFVHGSSVVRTKCWQELSEGLLSRKNIGVFDVAFAIYVMHSNSWADILDGYYEEVYPKGLVLAMIKRWNRCIQCRKAPSIGSKERMLSRALNCFDDPAGDNGTDKPGLSKARWVSKPVF